MLGGTPRCAGCGQLAYHAEQVMGPGRKLYHKPCLKCVNCQKRLDPGSLVEHEAEPYCKHCHGLLFGTKDLRSANVFSSSSNAPPSTPPRNASQQSSPRVQRTTSPIRRTEFQPLSAQPSPARVVQPHDNANTLSFPPLRFSHQAAEESLEQAAPKPAVPGKKRPLPTPPPKPSALTATSTAPHSPAPISSSLFKQPGVPVLPARHVDQPSLDANGEQETAAPEPAAKVYASIDELLNEPQAPHVSTHSATPTLPEKQPQYTSIGDAIAASTHPAAHQQHNLPAQPSNIPHRNHLLASSPYRSKPMMPARASPSGNEGCAGCGKTVYFAEGVNTIGKRWHKPCLKCASCRTTLDPGRVQDRDEIPYCKNCYTRDFGPTVLR